MNWFNPDEWERSQPSKVGASPQMARKKRDKANEQSIKCASLFASSHCRYVADLGSMAPTKDKKSTGYPHLQKSIPSLIFSTLASPKFDMEPWKGISRWKSSRFESKQSSWCFHVGSMDVILLPLESSCANWPLMVPPPTWWTMPHNVGIYYDYYDVWYIGIINITCLNGPANVSRLLNMINFLGGSWLSYLS